MRRKKEMKGIR
jgi:septum formation protein